MNLLSNLFNGDNLEIVHINKKYFLIIIIILLLACIFLFLEKDNYYLNTYTISEDKILILVDKDNINNIKKQKEIIINDIKCDYSINKITPVENSFLVSINLNTKIENISSGFYKVYLGKERLFDYIIRIIRK